MNWFYVSIAFSLIAWGIVTARYIWLELRLRPRVEALRPLLILHSRRTLERQTVHGQAARAWYESHLCEVHSQPPRHRPNDAAHPPGRPGELHTSDSRTAGPA